MLKRTIKYTDFDGNEQEEVHYFNLSKLEMMEMEVSGKGGSFAAWANRVVEAGDRATLIKEFKKLILDAYGVRSDDGKRFIKNDEVREAFAQTAAFEALFLELAMNDQAAVEFVIAILPADVQEQAASEMRKEAKTIAAKAQDDSAQTQPEAPAPSPLSTQ